MEAATEIADRREASGIADFCNVHASLTQQFCGTAQTDGANELGGFLTCGGLYLPV